MNITEFVNLSLGRWRSQRSAHHLAFSHYEQILSTIDIVALESNDPAALELCKTHDIDPQVIVSPFRMSWEGESDWEEEETSSGSTVLVPIPDRYNPKKGRLLREQGYAETIASIGNYHFTDDDTFVLLTPYERAMAEEKIWFATPNLRLRVSLIKTSAGSGITTASFSSEIRSIKS
jgi:phycoerythrin-associated linker protein